MTKERRQQLNKALEHFDQFVNAALRKDFDNIDALTTVTNYSILREELAKLLVDKE